MQFITVASAALAAIPAVQAGSAFIYNKCEFDVNVWSVSADGSSDAIPIKAGESYEETYKKPSVGGVSMKLMNNTDTAGPTGPISQFEYTLTNDIWYDMSNVDCVGEACPFAEHGWYLDASDDSCPTKKCEGGLLQCLDAYVAFNDDWNTCACSAEKDITLYLCTSEKPSSEEATPEEPATEEPASEQPSVNWVLTTDYGIPAHRRTRRHVRHPHSRSAML